MSFNKTSNTKTLRVSLSTNYFIQEEKGSFDDFDTGGNEEVDPFTRIIGWKGGVRHTVEPARWVDEANGELPNISTVCFVVE